MNKIKLPEVSIVIPTRIDNKDRYKNLIIILEYLLYYFKTNILLGEYDKTPQLTNLKDKYNINYKFIENNTGFFNKSYVINTLVKETNTSIIAIHDVDILVLPRQIIGGIKLIKDFNYDFIIPYNGTSCDLKKEYHSRVKKEKSITFIKQKMFNVLSVSTRGGLVFFDRDVFFKIGMFNEYIKSHGGEDSEIIFRASKLGYKGCRIDLPLYHLNHDRTLESNRKCKGTKKYRKANLRIYNKVRKKYKKKDLLNYIKSFYWVENEKKTN